MKLSLRINNHDLKAYSGWFLGWGIALVILGTIAISAATFTTLFSIIFVGTLITICGVIILIDTFAFWWRKWPGFLMHLVMSLLYLYIGIMLINNPIIGSATLTLLLGVFLILIGVSRIIYSLSVRVLRWQWSFINGFISLLLGILIVTNLASASLFIIGLFIGIDLIFCGIAYIMIALGAKAFLSNDEIVKKAKG
jgi:uncharacterized membrane protein HdeD (DUF308 family)